MDPLTTALPAVPTAGPKVSLLIASPTYKAGPGVPLRLADVRDRPAVLTLLLEALTQPLTPGSRLAYRIGRDLIPMLLDTASYLPVTITKFVDPEHSDPEWAFATSLLSTLSVRELQTAGADDGQSGAVASAHRTVREAVDDATRVSALESAAPRVPDALGAPALAKPGTSP